MIIECEVIEMKEGKPVKVEYEGAIYIKEIEEILKSRNESQ